MTGPHSETESPGTRPISVAELLARNGTIGAPAVTRRRRRRRGDNDAVTVAELTGEIPVVRDDEPDQPEETGQPEGTGQLEETDQPEAAQDAPAAAAAPEQPKTAYWSEPEPRWPKSAPQPDRGSAPERSAYPRPLPRADAAQTDRSGQAGAEDMSPDPVDHYAGTPVEVMDSEVGESEPDTEDSAYARSYPRDANSTLFGGQTLADELARRGGEPRAAEEHEEELGEDGVDADRADQAEAGHGVTDRLEALRRSGVVVLQSLLAVVFGAGLFVAFDQLWRWNSIVALVLSVLVILGLVVGVRVVRKTEDIGSTLIAVAVGALITLGPLALSLQSG